MLDFCGEDIQPSWVITKTKGKENENWVKFDLNVSGYSGKLKTTVIGDYLKHAELQFLEEERAAYYEERKKLTDLES